MNRERAKELLPIITAFAEGKKIEARWNDLGFVALVDDPKWLDGYEYRIAKEPKLRPWRPEEVPLGAMIRNKCDNLGRWISKEHSTDGGKTWLPCGVLEDVQ